MVMNKFTNIREVLQTMTYLDSFFAYASVDPEKTILDLPDPILKE